MATPIEIAVGIAASLDIRQVPQGAKHQARLVIADTLAVIQAGSSFPEPSALRAAYLKQGLLSAVNNGGSRVLNPGEALYTNAELAAYLNGTAGTFLELDEGMRPTGHAGIHVIPAALAVAEELGSSGEELLAAVIAGYETFYRLFVGIALEYPIHPHGHLGGVASAVSVALLRGTDPVAAAAIAATSPVFSVWEPCYEGATARNSWPGNAAQNGVRSQTMAEAGFTGSFRNLEIAFTEIAGSYRDESAMVAPLDYESLGVNKNYFKFHSCCALNHAAVEAVEEILETVKPQDVESIVVDTVANNMKIDRLAHPNNLSSRFSLPYSVAARFLSDESSIEVFNYREDAAEFSRKVSINNAEDLQELWPDSSPARLRVTLNDGSIVESRVDNPRGHFKNPPGPNDLKEKFNTLWGNPRVSNGHWDSIMNLETAQNVADLFEVSPE
ncbi:MAG: MmgE/PrpD family protein [Microbacteriaceae bacterium]